MAFLITARCWVFVCILFAQLNHGQRLPPHTNLIKAVVFSVMLDLYVSLAQQHFNILKIQFLLLQLVFFRSLIEVISRDSWQDHIQPNVKMKTLGI